MLINRKLVLNKKLIAGLLSVLMITSFIYVLGGASGHSSTLDRARTIVQYKGDPNAESRLSGWKKLIIERIQKYPLWGIGFGRELLPYEGYRNPHNSHLVLLARTGLIGFTFYLLFNYFFVKQLFILLKNRKTHPIFRNYAVGILSLYAFIMVFSSFNVVLELPYMGIFYWMILGLGIALVNVNRKFMRNRNSEAFSS